VAAELAAARLALRTAGIAAHLPDTVPDLDPAHEATVAWALREAVTNVVKHSGARTCRIALSAVAGATALEVVDDGRGPAGGHAGAGLAGVADRVQALGGTVEAGPGEAGGFRLRVWLGAAVPAAPPAEVGR
jgi:two-component system sensor histidine kinase DesK